MDDANADISDSLLLRAYVAALEADASVSSTEHRCPIGDGRFLCVHAAVWSHPCDRDENGRYECQVEKHIGGELPRLDVPEGDDPRAYFPQVTANALADFIIADAEMRGDD